jgi:MFS family permease
MTTAAPESTGIWLTWRESPLAAKAVLIGLVVNRLGAFIQVFLVLFLTDRGFSAVQAGVALSLYSAGAVVGSLVGGGLTDRLGARAIILLSMVGSAGLVLAVLYVRNYPALCAVVTAVGAVSLAYRPASATLLSEVTPESRQVMIFAMNRLALNAGTMAAPLLGAALVAISYDLLFWGEAVAALMYAVIAAVAIPRRDRAVPTEPTEPTGEDAVAAKSGGNYLVVLADRRFALFLVALFVNAVVYMQYLSVLPVAMRADGLPVGWFGAMVALNAVIVVAFELLITKWVQRMPLRLVVAAGFILLAAGRAFYALPFGAAMFVIGTLVWSLAEIVAGPTMFAYPAMASPKRLRGRYIGAATAVFGIGSTVGPIAGLALWELVGRAVWWLFGLAALLGLAAGWVGMRNHESRKT